MDVARILAPAGEAGLSLQAVCAALTPETLARDVALVTGAAGDVYLCHPFLVHAASWPHRGREPRLLAQPGVALRQPYPLTDTAGTPPVERAILLGLGR